MQARIPALLVAIGAVVFSNGCGDPTTIKASFANKEAVGTLAPLNGSPQDAPSAVSIRVAEPVTINPGYTFDLAFDLTPGGDMVVYTVRKIANELLPVQRVGLQTTQQAMEEVALAPTSGFVYDSLVVVPVGTTVLVHVFDQTCAGALKGANIYAKLRADSTDVFKGAIYLHMLSNPNCGFRSLLPGIPKE